MLCSHFGEGSSSNKETKSNKEKEGERIEMETDSHCGAHVFVLRLALYLVVIRYVCMLLCAGRALILLPLLAVWLAAPSTQASRKSICLSRLVTFSFSSASLPRHDSSWPESGYDELGYLLVVGY